VSRTIPFSRNYSDLSTQQGFQFEFFCNRCSTGARTHFKSTLTGAVSGAMGAAGSLLGGIFGRAADLTERVRSASWEKGHDAAFEEAVQEMKEEFMQCPRCSTWVCKQNCWNAERGLCKSCASTVAVETATAASTTCASCGVSLAAAAKFCPDCGARVQPKDVCASCGVKLAPGAKFCPDCGTKVQ
jgi:predicted RNA-binding Zn-ribbon protein involved in translation (DUF1610 family)